MLKPRTSFKTEKGTELPLMNLKGKEYLQVAHRFVWLDEKYPNYTLTTTFLKLTDNEAIAQSKIIIKDNQGNIIREATGTKRETLKDFADFIEKSETGSYGRALAMLGIGTQFATPDLDEIENDNGTVVNRLADAPTIAAIKVKPEVKVEAPVKPKGFKRPEAKPTPAQEAQYKVIMNEAPANDVDDAWN